MSSPDVDHQYFCNSGLANNQHFSVHSCHDEATIAAGERYPEPEQTYPDVRLSALSLSTGDYAAKSRGMRYSGMSFRITYGNYLLQISKPARKTYRRDRSRGIKLHWETWVGSSERVDRRQFSHDIQCCRERSPNRCYRPTTNQINKERAGPNGRILIREWLKRDFRRVGTVGVTTKTVIT